LGRAIHVYVDDEAYRLIEPHMKNKEAGQLISQYIKQNLSDLKFIQNDIVVLKSQLKERFRQKELQEKLERKKITELRGHVNTLHKQNFWKRTRDILEDNPNYVDGRVRLYNNEYGKSISKIEFLETLDKLKSKGIINDIQ